MAALWLMDDGISRFKTSLFSDEESVVKVRIRNSNKKRVRQIGFRNRMKTRGGRATLNRRRAKGRTIGVQPH